MMKRKFLCIFSVFLIILFYGCGLSGNINTSKHTISKANGKIILAYKAFEEFLNTDKSWDKYQSMLLDAYPNLKVVHNRQVGWGVIDTLKFPEEVAHYNKEDYEKYFKQYSNEKLNYLYDSVVENAHKILPPLNEKMVDLFFFLPYGSCFVVAEDSINTIFISMYINPYDVDKIMAHEYAHILHISRKPKEKMTLKEQVVLEGMAVYLTNQIIDDLEISNSVPFMPKESFEWCVEHEEMIKDSIQLELNDTSMNFFKRYISDGDFAEPPTGFVQKTAYFIGFRIIEECVRNGMTLEEICSMDSETVISRSGYF